MSAARTSELTIYFADDHNIVRDGLRVMTEREKGIRVVGEAADGRALVEGVMELNPDVVVTDMAMSELNGIEAVRQLRSLGYRGVIVMLSMYDQRRLIADAI